MTSTGIVRTRTKTTMSREGKIDGYIVEGEADKPLSGPLQKSADPIFTVISRLIRCASAEDVVQGDKANALRPVARR